jgi:hypothetical protein
VVVVGHLTVGVNNPVKAFTGLLQDVQPQFPVSVFDVDIGTPVPA